MPTSPFLANLAACQELLREIQEDLFIHGSQFLAEDVGRVASNIHRLRQQHDAAIEQLQRSNLAFQSKYTAEEAKLEEARRAFRIQEGKVQSRDETIEEQSRNIKRLRNALEKANDGEKSSYREGYLAAQAEIKNLEAKNQSLSQGVVQRDERLKILKRTLEKTESSLATNVATAYQRGLADGQANERNRNRQTPPQQPQAQQPQQRVDILKRERLLNELKLTNTSGLPLSANLEAAIKSSSKEMVAAVLQFENPSIRAPALHIAALFNDCAIASLLIKHGADVNESCVASSETGHLYGVTPMHLAVGAQNEAMIRCLSRHGAHFSFGSTPPGKRATGTPAYWLVSERWLRLTGGGSGEVLRILRVMKACGWDEESVVDRKGENLKGVVWRQLGGRPGLQRDVLGFLEGMVL